VCGRFVTTSAPERLALQFGATDVMPGPHRPRYNVAPSTAVPAIIEAEDRRLGTLRWGFVPSWASDPSSGPRPINARVEGVASSRLYSTPLRRQRCVVPIDGWYEWATVDGVKRPSLLTALDGAPVAIAAVWSTWRGATSDPPLSTVALLTTEATGAAATVHHRMPLQVPLDRLDAWLDAAVGAGEVEALLSDLVGRQPDVAVRRVSTRVNDVRNDDPSLLEPV
jgi:putative SOS response-associated peptidase YedK